MKEGPMSTEHKALVLKWFDEVWNKGRATVIDEMLTEHAVVHGLGPDLHGPSSSLSILPTATHFQTSPSGSMTSSPKAIWLRLGGLAQVHTEGTA
jgi:hypothetical protein